MPEIAAAITLRALSLSPRHRRLFAVAILAVLAAAVFLLRVFPGWEFLAPHGDFVVLPETDPYYHFRQALFTLRHFPALLRWTNDYQYPALLRNEASGLYDLFLAAVAKVGQAATGASPEHSLQWVCLFVPPLGAAVMVGLVFGLVRRHASLTISAAMALWYVLLPGDGLTRTSLGFCDHHVAEMVLSLLSIRGALGAVEPAGQGALPWWRPAWLSALPLAGFFFTWLGAPLYLPIFALAFMGQMAADALSGRDSSPTTRAALRYWLAFLILVGGGGLIFPTLVMYPPLWRATVPTAGLLLLALAALGWILSTPRLRLRAGVRVLLAAAILAMVIAGGLLLSPTLTERIREGLAVKPDSIAENVVVTPRYFFLLTGLAGILALLVPIVGLLTGAARRPGWWLALLPSTLLIALWCRVHDYAYLGALHAVVLTGYFWGAVFGSAALARRPATMRGALAAATALVVAGILLGATAPLRPGRELYSLPGVLPGAAWREAIGWLRTRPVPFAQERRAVLTDWQRGNLVNTLTDWPVVNSRYPQAEPMRALFQDSETAAREAPLHGSSVARTVRYVALEPQLIYDYFMTDLGVAGMKTAPYFRLQPVAYRGRSLVLPRTTAEFYRLLACRLIDDDGDGFEHFRLVFESGETVFNCFGYEPESGHFKSETTALADDRHRRMAAEALQAGVWRVGSFDIYDGRILPGVKIFEQVEGARITGRVAARATVTATLELELRPDGRRFRHHVATRADDLGHFTLIVPYATDLGPEGMTRAHGAWRISDGGRERRLEVPERAVAEGTTVVVAD